MPIGDWIIFNMKKLLKSSMVLIKNIDSGSDLLDILVVLLYHVHIFVNQILEPIKPNISNKFVDLSVVQWLTGYTMELVEAYKLA